MLEERKVNLMELSKESLISIILNLQSQTFSELKFFNITLKTNSSLKDCEETLNSIIANHKDLILNESRKLKNFLVENDGE